jgi:hypothetical protein
VKNGYQWHELRELNNRNLTTGLLSITQSFLAMALPAHSGPRPLIRLSNHLFTDGRTPWTSDQPVARPLPKLRTTQTQNIRIHTSNIHALSEVRTHDLSVRASEDNSCLRPRDYFDSHDKIYSSRLQVNLPLNASRINICSLFRDAIKKSECTASNDYMVVENKSERIWNESIVA